MRYRFKTPRVISFTSPSPPSLPPSPPLPPSPLLSSPPSLPPFSSVQILYHPVIGYMAQQHDITNMMRCILVDWIVEVCDEFHLLPDTLFAAVVYVDRYLSRVSVQRSKLQLVGVTCLYLSAKFEEIHPPDISEFAYITDDTYTKKQVILIMILLLAVILLQIVKMEHEILNVLSYNLVQPTSVTFLSYYLKLQHNSISSILKERVEHLSMVRY